MARKKYSCDFETTTDVNDCRVWAYGYMEIGNTKNYKIGNSIDEFMEWVEETKCDYYFHNLRFDGEFIVNWLLKNGYEHCESGRKGTFKTIISSMGQWYMIDISYGFKGKTKLHAVFYDSLKKLPFPVKKIAKDFKMEILKGDIDYHTYRPVQHEITPEELKYIKHDVQIVADALKIQFSQGLDKMTNGSDSLAGFKSIISKRIFEKNFPVFSLELDEQIRLAYRGGFTWINERYAGKEIGKGLVFDVNSLYPSQMYSRPLPYGLPIVFDGKYEYDPDYPLHIQAMECEFEIKENRIPTIQIKKNRMFKHNEYLSSSKGERVRLYMTNVDLELFYEHYDVIEPVYLNGYKFKSRVGMFNEFIDKWTYIKTTSEGAIKLLAKLMLNSLYGKFASNPDVTGKIPFLKKDGSCGFKLPKDEETGEVIKEYKDPVYTPMGVFITSWARYTTITTAQKCYDRIIYCDTDSIHLEGTETPEAIADLIDDNKLGYWAHETTFKRAKYIRQKTYVYEPYLKEKRNKQGEIVTDDGKTVWVSANEHDYTKVGFKVVCAGMPDKVKEKVTFDNFQIGFTSFGKLLPKHVSGGVVLVDTDFTIK